MPDGDWWRALWPDPSGVVAALQVEPGMSVVDLGCGDGYFTAAIARRVGPGRVFGVDLDPTMLMRARTACEGMTNCEWLLGDARTLSRLVPAPVDYVLLANTFHGAEDPTALAREVFAALRPAGRFAIVNWHLRPRTETCVRGEPRGPRTELRMSPEETQRVVAAAGFEHEMQVELPPFHYGIVFRRVAGR
jgi:SAM-dependent methyltransferase